MRTKPISEFSLIVENEWKRLLFLGSTNNEDNFFVLGGDSMIGTMLILSLMNTFDINLSLGDLYENPTLQEFISLIASKANQTTS